MRNRLRDKTRVLHKQTRCTKTNHTLSLTHSLTLSTRPRTLLAVSNLSVTVCPFGLSGIIICRRQEQIISERPCPPHFWDVIFNIWCNKIVVAWDRSTLQSVAEDCSMFLGCPTLSWTSVLRQIFRVIK
jgi:hypothetical protein